MDTAGMVSVGGTAALERRPLKGGSNLWGNSLGMQIGTRCRGGICASSRIGDGFGHSSTDNAATLYERFQTYRAPGFAECRSLAAGQQEGVLRAYVRY